MKERLEGFELEDDINMVHIRIKSATNMNRNTFSKIRTIAAIMVWFVVALLILNRVWRSEWITPIAIVLTIIAIVIYFSPRLKKGTKQENASPQS